MADEKTKLAVIDGETLIDMKLPPTKFCVDTLLPQGLCILGGASKIGKSWWVLDLCVRIAKGEPMWDLKTTAGPTLYLCLEDTLRRVQNRLLCITDEVPPNAFFATSAGTLSDGLCEQIRNFVKEHPDTVFVAVDTFQIVRNNSIDTSYANDYEEIRILKQLADELGICLLLVHHLRKMGDDSDPFNRISGTNGIMGALDTSIVLDREERAAEDTTFFATGRDIESQDKIIRFDKETCRWKMQGDADWLEEQRARQEYQNNPIVKTIKKLLDDSPDGQWSGNMSDLMSAGRYIARTNLAPTNRKLTSEVNKLEPLLLDYDGITHSRANNGDGGGKHHFSSCNSTVDTVGDRWPQCGLSTVTNDCNGTNGCNGTVYETDEHTPFDEQEEEHERLTE